MISRSEIRILTRVFRGMAGPIVEACGRSTLAASSIVIYRARRNAVDMPTAPIKTAPFTTLLQVNGTPPTMSP